MAPYGLVGWYCCTGRPYSFLLQGRRLGVGNCTSRALVRISQTSWFHNAEDLILIMNH